MIVEVGERNGKPGIGTIRDYFPIAYDPTGTPLLHRFLVQIRIVTGPTDHFAKAFSYTQCVKKKLLKWALVWAALGLVIPVLLLLRWKMTDSSFGQLEFILWPSSIMLMGLEGPSPRSSLNIAEVYAIVIAANVALYLLIGLLTCPFFFLILRWRNRSRVE
jgi:hypothetical protein